MEVAILLYLVKSLNFYLKQSSVFKSGTNWGQWKDKKQKYKKIVVLQIIDKNMTLYTLCMVFFPALPYMTRKATPHLSQT